MLVEMIVLAVTLVVAQTLVGFIALKYLMSERFLVKYTKKAMRLSNMVVEEMFKNEDES